MTAHDQHLSTPAGNPGASPSDAVGRDNRYSASDTVPAIVWRTTPDEPNPASERAAMAAHVATEGRFLGGRPPYGYRLADAGPHRPWKAKRPGQRQRRGRRWCRRGPMYRG
jgi:hypothetical protein